MNTKEPVSTFITIALSGGRLTTEQFAGVNQIVQKYQLSTYVTTMQNLRVLDIPAGMKSEIREELEAAGIAVKQPGQFPLPKVCAGKPYCKLAQADPQQLSDVLLQKMRGRSGIKPKIKLAIAACPANCSGAVLADIGVVATRSGYEVYAGGKGGPLPKAGKRIVRKADEEKVLEVIENLVDFHDRNTTTKQRMFKLLNHPDFPYEFDK